MHMHQKLLAMLLSPMIFAASSALAQTPAPGASPAPGATPAVAGGLADYWWIILLVVLAAAAIWYFMKGRNRV
jgi:hypothetical protein